MFTILLKNYFVVETIDEYLSYWSLIKMCGFIAVSQNRCRRHCAFFTLFSPENKDNVSYDSLDMSNLFSRKIILMIIIIIIIIIKIKIIICFICYLSVRSLYTCYGSIISPLLRWNNNKLTGLYIFGLLY